MVENLLEKQIEGEDDEEENLELWCLEPMAACSFQEEKVIYEIEKCGIVHDINARCH